MGSGQDANLLQKITDIEDTIARLSRQVATLRLEATATPAAPPAQRPPPPAAGTSQPAAQPSAPIQAVAAQARRAPWSPAINDPVTIRIQGENRDGTIVGFTAKRIKVRVGRVIFTRAANNVHLRTVLVVY
jgi:hypothetical protein